jgi:hypothetical protein
MRVILLTCALVMFCGSVSSQTTLCNFSIGFQNQDAISAIAPISSNTYLALAGNDTFKVLSPLFGQMYQMTIYKINNQCDTLWRKHFTPIGLGGLTSIKKVDANKFIVSGLIGNPQFFMLGSQPYSPFVMLIDSNGVPLTHQTYNNIVGISSKVIRLPSNDFLIAGYEISNPSSTDYRVFLALYDSSLNPKWYRQVMPQSISTQSGAHEMLITNDGCGLLLFTEQLFNPNRTRPRLVKFDLSTGDTIQTRLIQPNGVANIFELRYMQIYQNELFLSGDFRNFVSFTVTNNRNAIIVKVDLALNEKARFTLPNQTLNDMAFLASGHFANIGIAYFASPLLTRVYLFNNQLGLLDSSFNFQPSSLVISPDLEQFEANQWIAYGAVASSATNFGQSDMYFSVVNHSYGAPYVHDYCGLTWPDSIRRKPEAAFTATATADSIFFTNTSLSGLQCQPQIEASEWFIDNYQLSDTAFHLRVPITTFTDTLRIQLVVSNYFGCKDTLQARVVNNTGQILGVLPLESLSEGPRLYPNPAGEAVQVQIPAGAAQQVMYEVYALTGKKWMDGTLPSGTTSELRLATLQPGLYILQLQVGGQPYRLKFVKE